MLATGSLTAPRRPLRRRLRDRGASASGGPPLGGPDKAAWDAQHSRPPQLFRKAPFDVTGAPNRYGLDPFYSQHVWIWRPNPAGMLSMWNPKVRCRAVS